MDATTTATPAQDEIKRTDRILGSYLVFVAVRCTLQYIVLPFVLPFLGVSSAVSVWVSLIIELVALGAISYNIRRLWPTAWRWRYLALCAIMLPILLVFLVSDIRALTGI
jgi:hypothetical protein